MFAFVSRARTKPRFAFEVPFRRTQTEGDCGRDESRESDSHEAQSGYGGRGRFTTGKADRRETKGGGSPLCVNEVDDCSYSQVRASLKKKPVALCD